MNIAARDGDALDRP